MRPPDSKYFDAEQLYRIVETYAGFGDHRTGTKADRETADWLASVLRDLGAEVELEAFEFERYLVEASLEVDASPGSTGHAVPIAPVFYSGLGRTETKQLAVIELDRSVVGSAHGLDEFVSAVPDNGGALVIAIDGPDDLPVWCNRVPLTRPVLPGSPDEKTAGRATVIVPGNWANRVTDGGLLSFDARLETTTSNNVVATFGAASPDGGAEVIITTPLTGWTPAAGERGTGLATALAMAADLASDYRVRFVACSGHELDHIGLQHHLDANDVDGKPVIHLGASVGAVDRSNDETASLASGRMMLTTATEPRRSELATIAAEANWRAVDPTTSATANEWPGEGGGWRAAGASVLSFVGSFEHFHVASDIPAKATTPEALKQSTAVAIKTARRFLSS